MGMRELKVSPVPGPDKGIADRLKLLIGAQSILAFAQKCNVRYESIRQYLNGSMPGADKLAQIAEANNVTLDWLATGREPACPAPPKTPTVVATNREMMGYCLEGLAQLYHDLSIKIPMSELGREAADLHDALVAAGIDEQECLGAIRYAIALRRKQLQAERLLPTKTLPEAPPPLSE